MSSTRCHLVLCQASQPPATARCAQPQPKREGCGGFLQYRECFIFLLFHCIRGYFGTRFASKVFKVFFFRLPLEIPSTKATADRANSWDAFLCHGSVEVFNAPRSMLEAFPEVVQSAKVVPYRDLGSTICPRYLSSNNRTKCPCFHPRFYQRPLGCA